MSEQNKLIVIDFITLLAQKASDFLEPNKIFEIFGEENFKKNLFGGNKMELKDIPAGYSDDVLKQKVKSIVNFMSTGFGEKFADNKLEDIYSTLQKKHTPVLANKVILPLIPLKFLEKYRLEYLTKEELGAQIIALRELDRRKTEFLSIVAHQLRTPLSGLKWTLDMFIKGSLGPITQSQKDLLKNSYDGNERMIALVNQMLSANSVDSEKYELTKTKSDFSSLVEEVVVSNSAAAISKNVTLVFNKPQTLIPSFFFDRERMRDVLMNLVDNAVKYSLPHGKVSIDITQKDHELECKVQDGGIGIPKEQQKLIFSRFFRATNARTADPNGNGLGLFIVERIVKLHGGKVWFESEEGRSTAFFFRLELTQ